MQQFEAYRPFQVSPVRGGELLLPIRTSSIGRPKHSFQRPRPIGVSSHERPLELGPSDTLLYHQSCSTPKAGFKGLFNRNKSSKAVVSRVPMDITQDQTDDFQGVVGIRDTLISSSTILAKQRSHVSLHQRPERTKTSAAHKASMIHKQSPRPESALIWAPPPLCRAYSHAVKSATLLAPKRCMAGSARHDALLRKPSKGYRLKRASPSSEFGDSGELSEHVQKGHTRRIPGSTSVQDWSRKIYMLTTSGYLLQYANEGDTNRLPEKILQLWKESVAFASDAIPGKHWVLQISQTPNIEGKFFTDAPRSIFGKLGPREQTEEPLDSFLLVLNSPEEMDSWLVTIRNEIQALSKSTFQPDHQCYDPVLEDSQKLPKKSIGHNQNKSNAEQVYSALARVPPAKSSVPEVAKADCMTMRMDDGSMTNHVRGPPSTGRQSTTLNIAPTSLRSTDSTVYGRIRNSSTASNASTGSTTLIPSASSSTANLPAASSVTCPDASTSCANYTNISFLDTRASQQSPMQFSNGQRNSQVWPACPRQESGYSQEAHGFENRFSTPPSCWISDVREPYASAIFPPQMLLPTTPASVTHLGRPSKVPSAARRDVTSNDLHLTKEELPVSNQPCSSAKRTSRRLSPNLHSAQSCLPNPPSLDPPLSPYALTSFDLYGLSHTRPPSTPMRPDLAIPRRTSSLRHSRRILPQSTGKSAFSPPPCALQVSPVPARGPKQPCQDPRPTSIYLSQASKATGPHPSSVKSEIAVPRRYSSIAHPRIFSPQHASYQTDTPVPAPITACAAVIPRNDNKQQHERQWFTHVHLEQEQELGDLTNTLANIRLAPSDIQLQSPRHSPCPRVLVKDQVPILCPPSWQEKRKIDNRRSTSQIPSLPFLGPPICPPPSCPLPRIPAIELSPSEGSLRNRDTPERHGIVAG